MLSLTIKDIREAFSDTLFKFYSLSDFTIRGTKTKDKDKEFRIEFRIYDTEFWMDIDPSIDSIHIATRSINGPDHLDTIQMWLSKPFDYDKDNFQFGWRTDLEAFFDAFHEVLVEKVEKKQKTTAASVYGLSTKDTEAKETKPSIFNGLDDQEDRDEYI
jgi:hypothetical protein